MQTAIIKKIENGSSIALLEIDVSTDELLESLNWEQSELSRVYKIRSEKKKKEWLGVRLLLKELFKDQSFELNYNNQGKPYVTNHYYHISISHSGKYICILANQQIEVGIDIQVYKHNIEKGTSLFMSEKELQDWDLKLDSRILHLYWGAKESIYKFIGLKKTNIKTDIYISPFELKKSGIIQGKFKNEILLDLNYEITDEYVLVYTV